MRAATEGEQPKPFKILNQVIILTRNPFPLPFQKLNLEKLLTQHYHAIDIRPAFYRD